MIPWRRAWQLTTVFLLGQSPWTEEPSRLQAIGLQGVGRDWSDLGYGVFVEKKKKNGKLLYNTGSSAPYSVMTFRVRWGAWGGRDVPERGDICILMADSCVLYGRNQHNIVIILQLKTNLWKMKRDCGGGGLVTKSCPTLATLPGYSVHGIFQARILKWVAISYSWGFFQPRDQTWVSCTTGRFNTVHGILQARILEWVVVPFSRGYSQPRNRIGVSYNAGGFFTSWATREKGLKTT